MGMLFRHGGGGVDEAVLAELRAIRGEIQGLREAVGQAATRADLDNYVRTETFNAHVAHQQRVAEGWRAWLPIALASLAVFWTIIGPYIHFGTR